MDMPETTREKAKRGRFVNIRKHNGYCFIKCLDGSEYFCHRAELWQHKDWEYVWEGNWCTFVPSETVTNGKHKSAFAVIPDHKKDPEAEIRKQRHEADMARHEEKLRIKEENRKKAEEKKKWKEEKEKDIKNHLVYYIAAKRNDKWLMYNRHTVFPTLEEAKAEKERLKTLKPTLIITIKKALRYEFGGTVAYIDYTNNKVGKRIA